MPSDLPLVALRPGQGGVIERVDADSPAGQRLLDLGFVPKTKIRVVRQAPLGDPILYDLRGTRLCLRRSEAATIHVRPDAGDCAPA